jgi:hypothetical protein
MRTGGDVSCGQARLIHQIEEGGGGAHGAAARDELADETRNWIDDLVTRVCER